MAFIKNPNFDPNDPNSKRYIEAPSMDAGNPPGNVTIFDPFANNKSTVSVVEPSNKINSNVSVVEPSRNINTGLTPTPAPVSPAQTGKQIYRIGGDIYDASTNRKLGPEEFNRDYSGKATEVRAPEMGVISQKDQETVDRLERNRALSGTVIKDTTGLGDLVAQAGKSGLSLEDTLALIQASTGVTAGEREDIRNTLGIPGLIDKAFTPPSETTQDIYNKAYESSGLAEVKNKISQIDNEIAKITKDASDAVTAERKNPFLSQATRSGRLSIIDRDAQQRITNLTNQRSQLLSEYDRGVGEIEGVITRYSSQLETDKAFTVDKLNFLLDEAERRATAISSERGQEGLRYIPDYLSAISEVDPFSKESLDIQLKLLDIQKKQQELAGVTDPNEARIKELELQKLEADVAKARGEKTSSEKDNAVSIANTALSNIDKLLGDTEGLSDAVGTISSKLPTLEGSTADFERIFEQVQDLFALGNTDKIKGAMSDKDIELLRNASSGLSLNMSEKGFRKKLEEIKKLTISGIGRQLSQDFGVTQSEAEQLLNNGSVLEVRDFLEARTQKKNDNLSLGESAMRTDRHNNPTAFTVDIAKQAGLIEGKDYEVGDPFPNNPNQKTAKLLGDPVDETIRVIDKIGFYTNSGNQRWTHTAMSRSQWNALDYNGKKRVIQQMYKNEGNNGALNNYFV